MTDYAEWYYAHQTTARGLLDPYARRRRFERLAPWYARRLRYHLPADREATWLGVAFGSGNFLYFLRRAG